MSQFLKFNLADLKKVVNGLILVILSAAITYLAETIPGLDFGLFGPAIVLVLTGLLDMLKKWLSNSNGQFLKGESKVE